jgi:FAD/FMN-containing dehydrogenase
MVQALVSNSGSGVSDEAVAAFAASLDGSVLTPGDAGYDDARKVFNGMIDRKPGLIALPVNTSDVQKAVNFARENNLLLSVNCGGHSVQGYGVCDGGLMVNLAKMQSVTVDPEARTAVAEGGANWGIFDAATQAHGLAVTGGRNPTTGIAGLTLGSGSGWLERKLGYTVDNLLGCEIVLANGEVIQANEKENSELFWGLRGGGGNFGIVTKFTYRLHKIGPTIYGGQLAFPRIPAALKAYRDFMESAPDDVGGAAALITAPHEEFVPPPVRGMPVMGFVICYTGDPADGPEAIKPLLDLGPAINMCEPMPYVALQAMLEPGQLHGIQNYWKAGFYPELPDEAIDALMAAAADPPSPLNTIIVQPTGGAVHRVSEDSTAMGWRSAKWALHILGSWEDPADDEKNIAWVRNIDAAMKPWAQEAAYLNYLMDEGEERIKASFGAHYDRMVALKNKYDPANFFRLNQNIKPTV